MLEEHLKELLKNLIIEYNNLLKKSKEIEKYINSDVKGSLVIIKRNNKVYYYNYVYDKKKRKYKKVYLRKDDIDTITFLAQKSYYKKVLEEYRSKLKHLSKLIKLYKEDRILNEYLSYDQYRKDLVNPIEIPFEEATRKWAKEIYLKKEFEDNSPIILTKNKERVRSKSEKILADLFFDNGLTYKYEYPLLLKNGLEIRPDFTFISPNDNKKIYWEHFGMMDDPKYIKNFKRKIETYAKNDILIGKNLIVSFELSTTLPDIEYINKMIKLHLVG